MGFNRGEKNQERKQIQQTETVINGITFKGVSKENLPLITFIYEDEQEVNVKNENKIHAIAPTFGEIAKEQKTTIK
ncbi:hypothetical protein EV201_1285 [Ancylomarina subtilis]|uniref:Uncharacterized protein n=1 Tax=Ancylomarina subtilis TaxID=1639035 RepID=A0A4Q7VKH8_9BACT|nr:hypothetical protein EV201_1285 [Ancylomarina subtilis]